MYRMSPTDEASSSVLQELSCVWGAMVVELASGLALGSNFEWTKRKQGRNWAEGVERRCTWGLTLTPAETIVGRITP